jgi:hypothetical protein
MDSAPNSGSGGCVSSASLLTPWPSASRSAIVSLATNDVLKIYLGTAHPIHVGLYYLAIRQIR